MGDTPHRESCPVAIRRRLEEGCPWCAITKRRKSPRNASFLLENPMCNEHNAGGDWVYRGKTYPITRETIRRLAWESKMAERRRDRGRKEADLNRRLNSGGLEAFAQ